MDLFIAWDGDHIGRQVGRMSLEDDVEGLRRVSQAIDHGNAIWRSWAESTGGSLVSYGGDEGRAQVPADRLTELPRIRRQYEEAVGATVSVGVGMKLSDADKALFVAKLRGGNTILIYTPEMEPELQEAQKHPETEADKLSQEYLVKTTPGAGAVSQEAAATMGPGQETAHLIGKNRGAHAGFAGHTQPKGGGTDKPVPTQRDHSEIQSVQQTINGVKSPAAPAEPAAAGGDSGASLNFEDQFHSHAQDQEDKDQQDASQNDQALDQLRAQVVQVLQQVKQQAPILSELQGSAPDAYAAVMNMAGAMIALARQVNGGGDVQPEPGPETSAPQPMGKSEGGPMAPHKDLPSEPGYVYHATNEDNARDIANSGLHVHEPWHGTDQSTWPDGSTQKRSYHSAKAGQVWHFAPEDGRPVILRTHTGNHPFRQESTGDTYTTKPIAPHHLEILLHGGSWVPLQHWAGVAKNDEAAIPGKPSHHHLHLPVGSQVGNKVKVQHQDSSTSWKELSAGQVMSTDPSGHPASSREPGAR